VSDGTVYCGSADYNLYALDATTGQLKWKYNAGLYVTSSPAVSDDTVYFGGNNYIYALDATTGQEKWSFQTGDNPVFSSPVVSNGTVYCGSCDQHIYALDAATGKEKWGFATGGEVGSPTVS
jgi:outer membrane protein assembly factor BamB